MNKEYLKPKHYILSAVDLNKTFENKNQTRNLDIREYLEDKIKLNEGKNNEINNSNNPIKITSLLKDEQHKKNIFQNLTKKENIMCKGNKLNTYKKNKSYLNNEYCLTDYKNNNQEKNNKIRNLKLKIYSNKKLIANKAISKDKTLTYSGNNTFNTNTNTNTYINNIGNNYQMEKDLSNFIKISDGELNLTNNSDNSKNPNYKTFYAANIRNINSFKKIDNINENNNNISNEQSLCEYYSLKDKLIENQKRRNNLLNESLCFYYSNKERGILNKIKQFHKKSIEKELLENGIDDYNKKLKLYSKIRRLPTKICFNKGKSNSKDDREDLEIYYKYNNDKFLHNLINKKNKGESAKKNDNYLKLITKGLAKSKDINKDDIIFKNKLIINSNKNKNYEDNSFIIGKNFYPLINNKKILKNILPKEVDYNTQFTIMDLINDEMHPLNRFQKKNLTQHYNLISQEIELLFGKNIALSELPYSSNIYQNKQNLIAFNTGEKYNELLKTLMKPKEKEIIVCLDLKEEERKKKENRRQYVLGKFKDTIKKCSLNYKRLNITKEFFWEILFNENPISYKDCLYIFNVIKDGDIAEIQRTVKKNAKLALFKDEFNQTPLHICAKRNLYQVVKLFVTRLADVNAQDIFGRTPLMLAAQQENLEFVCVILFSFADPSYEDKKGKKAIDYTHNTKIQYVLKYARIIHLFNRMMTNLKDFDGFVYRGLSHLFLKELGFNYEPLLEINNSILMKTDSI